MPTLKDWLEAAPFTLAMSSSFFGWYAHLGFLKALLDEGVRPARVTGASAGAMAAVCYASGADMDDVIELCLTLTREELLQTWFDAGAPFFGLFRISPSLPLIDALPVTRLEDCPIPIAISVFDTRSLATRVFAHGDIREVVSASASVPGMMEPVRIRAVDTGPNSGPFFYDGGCRDIGGLAGCDLGRERVLYHHCTVVPQAVALGVLNHSASGGGGSPTASGEAEAEAGGGAGGKGGGDLTLVVVDDLPIITPLTMEKGRAAYAAAYAGTRNALAAEHAPVMRHVSGAAEKAAAEQERRRRRGEGSNVAARGDAAAAAAAAAAIAASPALSSRL
jgi:NTE family protein